MESYVSCFCVDLLKSDFPFLLRLDFPELVVALSISQPAFPGRNIALDLLKIFLHLNQVVFLVSIFIFLTKNSARIPQSLLESNRLDESV